MNTRRILATFNVATPKEFLDKLYAGDFSAADQELLEEELLDQDLSLREAVNILTAEDFKNKPYIFN